MRYANFRIVNFSGELWSLYYEKHFVKKIYAIVQFLVQNC